MTTNSDNSPQDDLTQALDDAARVIQSVARSIQSGAATANAAHTNGSADGATTNATAALVAPPAAPVATPAAPVATPAAPVAIPAAKAVPQPGNGGNGGDPTSVSISGMGIVGGAAAVSGAVTVNGSEPGILVTMYVDIDTLGNAVPDAVDFQTDGASHAVRVAVDASGRATWTLPRLYQAGQTGVTATPLAKSPPTGQHDISGRAQKLTITLVLASSLPTLSITAPQASTSVSSTGSGAEVQVSVTTADTNQFGPRQVTVRTDTGASVGLQPVAGSSTQWAGTVTLSELPLGNRQITATCACGPNNSIAASTSVTIDNLDKLPPILQVLTPPSAGGALVVDPASLTAQFNGTASDSQSGMNSGKASVAVSLSPNGAQTVTTPGHAGDWSTWSASLKLPSLGSFTLYVFAVDAAGNAASMLAWPFEAISSYVATTLDDRLSDVQYLAALMQFARDQVTAGASGAVSSSTLDQVLGQPLDKISALPANPVVELSINELRVPLEILRAHIAENHVSTQPGAVGEAHYLWSAYLALLSAMGTTYAELRLARGADDATRAALAARLGITLSGPAAGQSRPDQLDGLTLDPSKIAEATLEGLFGLPATTAGLDPFRVIQPQLVDWQIAAQRSRWRALDIAPVLPVAYSVIVDPDVITPADVVSGGIQSSLVTSMLQSRAQQLATQASALGQTTQSALADPAKLTALLAQGIPGVDVSALHAQELAGVDISTQLSAAGLDRKGYVLGCGPLGQRCPEFGRVDHSRGHSGRRVPSAAVRNVARAGIRHRPVTGCVQVERHGPTAQRVSD